MQTGTQRCMCIAKCVKMFPESPRPVSAFILKFGYRAKCSHTWGRTRVLSPTSMGNVQHKDLVMDVMLRRCILQAMSVIYHHKVGISFALSPWRQTQTYKLHHTHMHYAHTAATAVPRFHTAHWLYMTIYTVLLKCSRNELWNMQLFPNAVMRILTGVRCARVFRNPSHVLFRHYSV